MQDLLRDGEAHGRLHDAGRAVGLAPRSVRVLLHLSARRPAAMRDLAGRFGCDGSYITMLINDLEQRGIAVRQIHPRDGRVKTVVLTDHGVEVLSEVQKLLWEPPPSFAVLTPAEQRQLRDLLKKVAAADRLLASDRAVAASAR